MVIFAVISPSPDLLQLHVFSCEKEIKWKQITFSITIRLERKRANARSAQRTFSDTEAKPLVGCCVLMSNTWNLPSKDVATNLFMLMSFLSNSTEHTCQRNGKEVHPSRCVYTRSARHWIHILVNCVKVPFSNSSHKAFQMKMNDKILFIRGYFHVSVSEVYLSAHRIGLWTSTQFNKKLNMAHLPHFWYWSPIVQTYF